MVELSPHMLELLHRMDDHAVGGRHISAGIPSFDAKETRRELMDLEKWSTWEGVHFNPTRDAIWKLARNGADIEVPSYVEDVVGQMDFDFYEKDGAPKVKNPPTWQDIIEKMKEVGAPLPYCVVPSGTPGNFHMLWIFDRPKTRGHFQSNPDILAYWGADARFRNSTSRNPEFRVHNPDPAGNVTHWWPEWADEIHVVEHIEDMVGVEYYVNIDDSYAEKPRTKVAKTIKRHRERLAKERLTYPKLLARMAGATDGDGRFELLCNYTTYHIAKFYREHGRAALRPEVHDIVAEGNARFAEPMSVRRFAYITNYWGVLKQEEFIGHQYRAGMRNFKARESKLETMAFYFHILDLREELRKFEDGEAYSLTPDKLRRAVEFTERRKHRGLITTKYVAHVADVWTEEKVDEETGEVTPPELAVRRLVKLLSHGVERGYRREDMEEGYAQLQRDIDAKRISDDNYAGVDSTTLTETSSENSVTESTNPCEIGLFTRRSTNGARHHASQIRDLAYASCGGRASDRLSPSEQLCAVGDSSPPPW